MERREIPNFFLLLSFSVKYRLKRARKIGKYNLRFPPKSTNRHETAMTSKTARFCLTMPSEEEKEKKTEISSCFVQHRGKRVI